MNICSVIRYVNPKHIFYLSLKCLAMIWPPFISTFTAYPAQLLKEAVVLWLIGSHFHPLSILAELEVKKGAKANRL